jgi:two-component system sensor histidine kinase KdpD
MLALAGGGLLVTSAGVWILEHGLGVPNASAVYLVIVAVVAATGGTLPAVATAGVAVALYNLLFVEPRLTLAVSRVEDLVTLALLLFVGVVISRLAGLQRARERDATRREQEARALFGISREIVKAEHLADALDAVALRLVAEGGLDRIWIGLGPTPPSERVVAVAGAGDGNREERPDPSSTHHVLHRDTAEGAARWVRIHAPTARPRSPAATRGALFRVEISTGARGVGSLWGSRVSGSPSPEETRLLAAAADQIGAAIGRERLAAEAADAEVARRGDELKSALLDSASHDLRTPLATIRAAAGTIADPAVALADDERRAIARDIDAEAERLSRLVGDLLDMSRIQGGVLVPDIEIIPLESIVRPAVERLGHAAGQVSIELPEDLSEVRVDAALLDRIVANLLDNAVKFAGPAGAIRVRAAPALDGRIDLVVEDAGPGVPERDLARIFDRFARLGPGTASGRRGVGLGLSVVRGLTLAMGGEVTATASTLGGLAVTVRLNAHQGGGAEE